MTRLRVWLNGQLRIDAPTRNANPDDLARAVYDMESECLLYNHSLAVVLDDPPSGGQADNQGAHIYQILARV